VNCQTAVVHNNKNKARVFLIGITCCRVRLTSRPGLLVVCVQSADQLCWSHQAHRLRTLQDRTHELCVYVNVLYTTCLCVCLSVCLSRSLWYHIIVNSAVHPKYPRLGGFGDISVGLRLVFRGKMIMRLRELRYVGPCSGCATWATVNFFSDFFLSF